MPNLKNCRVLLFSVFYFLFSVNFVNAIVDPLASENNIYGIHVIDENDLEDAAKLVNSQGGEWGYVTIVIREDDRDLGKWQKTFDRMRELKLIPLVRLATKPEGSTWAKPKFEDINSWTNFLNSLNWVVKNRYVILFNEPNHANEWGGQLNPEEYAKIAKLFHDKLKVASSDFFILPAGFDVSAPNSNTSMDAGNYFSKMHSANPGVFGLFDGWNSHSYPNPGFSSSPDNKGRGGIKSFEWETSLLEGYGLKQRIPVFITETGWVHKEGKEKRVLGYSSETVGEFYKTSFESVWRNSRIVAVTPFVLNYQDKPFDRFSWKKYKSGEFYPQYSIVQSLQKTHGNPEQINNSQFVKAAILDKFFANSEYEVSLKFKNTGQSIWELDGGFGLGIFGFGGSQSTESFGSARPGSESEITAILKTPEGIGKYNLSFQLEKNGKPFGEKFEKEVQVLPLPLLKLKANLGFKPAWGGLKLLIFDNNNLIKEIDRIEFLPEADSALEMNDISPGKEYKFVLQKSSYFQKERTVKIEDGETIIDFGVMLPLDFDGDNKFGFSDILATVIHPIKSINLIFSNSQQ